jgi:hypothetical protein
VELLQNNNNNNNNNSNIYVYVCQIKPGVFRVSIHLTCVSLCLSLRSAMRLPASFLRACGASYSQKTWPKSTPIELFSGRFSLFEVIFILFS